MAFSLFVNAAKGISSLQLSRYLGLHAKTAFVLLHKLRCALMSNAATTQLSGVVEIDGGWFGGHVRPENHRVARIDRRRRQHQSGKRRCVVVMRQRGGPTVTTVVNMRPRPFRSFAGASPEAALSTPTRPERGTNFMPALT